MTARAAVIFGVGDPAGIGAATARRCAAGGLTVYAVGRHSDKLEKSLAQIQAYGARAKAITDEVGGVFEQVEQDQQTVAFVLHNVGRLSHAPFLQTSAADMESAWRGNCLSGFHVAQAAIRHMLPQQQGTLVFTGASASLRGGKDFAAFAAGKAGLRIYAQAMAREFGPKGIHVAHVIVDGLVAGQRGREAMPEAHAKLGADEALSPDSIAETYWQLHQQHRTTWTHELDLRPFSESW